MIGHFAVLGQTHNPITFFIIQLGIQIILLSISAWNNNCCYHSLSAPKVWNTKYIFVKLSNNILFYLTILSNMVFMAFMNPSSVSASPQTFWTCSQYNLLWSIDSVEFKTSCNAFTVTDILQIKRFSNDD